jgi:hypothetical protein
MTSFTDMSAFILREQGESVFYQAGEAEAVTVLSVVTRYEFGLCPQGWPGDLFRNMARHASFRLSPADVPAKPTHEDTISVDGLAYRVRNVQREPKTGPEPLWWICLCANDQRGKY